MKKIQKIEFITIILFLLTFDFFLWEAFNGIRLFGESKISQIGIVAGIMSGILTVLFTIVYIVKIVKENNRLIKILWSVFPIVAISFTILYANGVNSFNLEMMFLNIISIILEIVMVALYNLFFWYYYGKEKRTIITLILYNVVVVYNSINGAGIEYIHNYYLGILLFAILAGYIELMICNKLKRK